MSSNAGNISVGLVLNGADAFIGKVNHSSKSLDRYGKSVKIVERHTDTWLHKTRDAAIVLGLARSAVENLNLLFTGMPRAILQQNAQLERSQVLIAGMDTSADSYANAMERASSTVNDLVNMSSSSPFGIQSIADSYAKLQASGIEDTANQIEALIDASAKAGANSEGLKRASIAIQQMAGKGVLSMEELRQQLGESIPTAMRMMSDATGMRMSDLVKKISTGTVESQSALDNFFDEMSFSSLGAAEAMAQTLEGLNNRIKNSFIKLAKEVGDAGFTDEIKEIGEEFESMLNSGLATREVGEALAVASRVLFEISVLLTENIRLITVLVGALAARSVFGKMTEGAVAFNAELAATAKRQAALASASSKATRVIEAHQHRLKNAHSEVWDSFSKEVSQGKVRLEDMGAAYARHERKVENYHNERIRRAQAIQAEYRRTASTFKNVGKNFFSAIGGWTTVVTAAIAGAIYLLDEFIWKQQRAAENLIKNDGLNSTVEEIKLAKEQLSVLDQKIQKQKEARESHLAFLKQSSDPTIQANIDSGQATASYDAAIRALEEQKNKLVQALEVGQKDIAVTAFESGSASAKRLIYVSMNEISMEYNKQKEALRKQLENSGLTGEEFTDRFRGELEALRGTAIDALREATEAQKTLTQKEIDLLEKKEKKSQQELYDLEKKKGQLKGLDEIVAEQEKRLKTNDVIFLDSSNAKLSAEESLISKLKLKEKLYDHRLARLAEEVQYGEELIRVEEQIIQGKLKGYEQEAVAVAKAADASMAKLKAKQRALAEEKRLTKDIKKTNERLEKAVVSMAKRLGTSQGQSLNEFMKWKVASEQNAEAIQKMREQYEKFGKSALNKEQQDLLGNADGSFSQLESMARMIDLNNIIIQQSEYRREVEQSLETAAQSYERETAETRNNLLEVRKELYKKLSATKRNTSEWFKINEAIVSVENSLNSAALAAERMNPKTDGWYQLSDDITNMSDQVDNQLATSFDGVMDGFVDSLWDAEASFSDSIDSMIEDIGKFITKMLLAQSIQQAVFSVMGAFSGSPSPIGGASMYGGAAFANGGIMSSVGEVPLRKYAKGGIATSPQLALFGEGAHNEAYVPLPDGRTIPVTMEGGQAPVVNVINQTGTQADVEHSSRFDGEKYITDVVMKAASRPGKFRDALNR